MEERLVLETSGERGGRGRGSPTVDLTGHIYEREKRETRRAEKTRPPTLKKLAANKPPLTATFRAG